MPEKIRVCTRYSNVLAKGVIHKVRQLRIKRQQIGMTTMTTNNSVSRKVSNKTVTSLATSFNGNHVNSSRAKNCSTHLAVDVVSVERRCQGGNCLVCDFT